MPEGSTVPDSDAAIRQATAELATRLVATLTERHLTIAVAESLTGGLVVAELVAVPGASLVLNGGVVAYNTEVKHTVLGVDAQVLASHGPVHPDVASQLAANVREVLAVGGVAADVGIGTTGVAGPEPQGGHPVGTVFVGIAVGPTVVAFPLNLDGDRRAIRERVVYESLLRVEKMLDEAMT